MVTPITDQNTTTEATPVLTVTPGAVSKIKEILAERDLTDHALRVFVSGGGCSGLQYGMAIEPQALEDDARVEVDGVRLLVDSVSLDYLRGASIDYVDDVMGGGFRIDNPNATSGCNCGQSSCSGDSDDSAGGCGCGGSCGCG